MEYLDIVDENNNLIGKKEERNIIHEKGIWHREVAVWIINEEGEILLQKRSANKIQEPNKWAICAGHVDAGENVETAVLRELEEELGFKAKIEDLDFISIEKISNVVSNNLINNNFTYMYITKTDTRLEEYKIQYSELSELKYISFKELERIVNEKDSQVTISNKTYMSKIIEEIRKRI